MDNPIHNFIFCIFLIANCNFQSTTSQQYSQFQPSWTPSDHPQYPQSHNINFNQNINSSVLGESQNFGKLVYNRDSAQLPPGGYNPTDRRPVQAYGPVPSSAGSESSIGNSRYIPSTSTSISGDYCWDPIFACDTAHTILYCLNARCTCPSGWTIAPGNLPLNTVWYPAAKRCVSLIGSGCHTSSATVSSGYVDCQPGIRCIPHPTYKDVGTCGGTNLKVAIWALIPLWMFSFVTRSV